MFEQAWKLLLLTLAIVLVAVGLMTFLLPIPLGIVPLLIGIALLMAVSPAVRRRFHGLRRRHAFLDRWLTGIEPHLPVSLRKILKPDNIG